jgi:predicted alpha/beta hydrolase
MSFLSDVHSPYQLALQIPSKHERWIMWFLGNGEVYEMMLQDFQTLAAFAGMNILVFNYRGVNHSEGRLVQAWDLVEDGRLCLDHLVVRCSR